MITKYSITRNTVCIPTFTLVRIRLVSEISIHALKQINRSPKSNAKFVYTKWEKILVLTSLFHYIVSLYIFLYDYEFYTSGFITP